MIEFSAIGYAGVGVLYAVLSILLLTSWRGRGRGRWRWRMPGGHLIVASLVSTIWAATLAIQMSGTQVPFIVVFAVEEQTAISTHFQRSWAMFRDEREWRDEGLVPNTIALINSLEEIFAQDL